MQDNHRAEARRPATQHPPQQKRNRELILVGSVLILVAIGLITLLLVAVWP